MSRLALLQRRVRRTLLARRRLLAGLLAATAVLVGLQAAAAPPPPLVRTLVAARDLPGGATVRSEDVAWVGYAGGSVPDGAVNLSAAVGRTLAAPVRAGEPLTDVRLLGGSLLDAYAGAVAAPVRIGDPAAVRLLRVGDVVDVIAADPSSGETTTVADDAPVIALPQVADGDSVLGAPAGSSGALVVLAVPDATARGLAGAGVSSYLSVVLDR